MYSKWKEQALCSELPREMFFPTDGGGVVRAQKVCAMCPVAQACLEYALTNRIEHGVWGGCSERKRRRILSQRNRSMMNQKPAYDRNGRVEKYAAETVGLAGADLEADISVDLEADISADLEADISADLEADISVDLEADISTDLEADILVG